MGNGKNGQNGQQGQKVEQRYNNIIQKIVEIEDDYKEKKIRLQALEEERERYESDIKLNEEEVELLEKSRNFLQKLVDDRTHVAYSKIEEVMNWCLSRVPLKQRYKLKIEEHGNANGRGVTLKLIDIDTNQERSLKTQTGTAIAQIVSFLLLVVVISISGKSRVMVLDEVFSGLDDDESIRNFSDILQALTENEGFQFHIVEQNRDIASNEDINVIPLDLEAFEEGLKIVDK